MINKIGQSINTTTLEATTGTPQPPQETQVTESPKYEPLVQAHSTEYASSLMGERRMSNLAIEFSLRNKLDAQLISMPTKTPEVPTTFPPGNAEGPTGNVGIGAPGDVEVGKGQSGLQSDPASLIPTPMSQHAQGDEVKLLQMELNKWRKENGQEPLDVTGNFEKDTTEALKEFQRANNLNDDGVFGPITKSHMILENNDNFKGLPESDQRLVRQHMLAYGDDDPARRDLVVDFATRPDFLNCESSIARENTLNYIATPYDLLPFKGDPKDHENLEKYLETRTEMAKDPNFAGLSQDTKDQIDEESARYLHHRPDKMEFLKSLTTSESFAKLEPESGMMLQTLSRVISGGQSRFNEYQGVLDQITEMDSGVKARVVNAAFRNGGNDNAMQSLNTMVSSSEFKNSPPDLQQQMINFYFVLNPGTDIEIG